MKQPGATAAGLGVRVHLAIMVLVALLPAWGLTGFVAWRFAATQRTAIIAEAQNAARDIAATVEREIATQRASLAALATSPELAAGDLEAFRHRAVPLLAADGVRVSVNPIERDPTQPEGRSAVSNLLTDPETARQAIALSLRIPSAATPVELAIVTDTIGFWNPALRRIALPPGWVAVVLDGDGRIIARSERVRRLIGQSAHPDVAALLRADPRAMSGWSGGATRDELSLHIAWRRIRGLPWTVLVGVPRPVVDGLVSCSVEPVVLGGLVLLVGLSLALAAWGRRRLAQPLLALAEAAAAVGRGAVPASLPRSGVREMDTVADALVAAAAERRDREAEAMALAARLKAVLDHVPVGVALAEAPSGRILLANRRLAAMLAVPEADQGRLVRLLAEAAEDADGKAVPPDALPLRRILAGERPAPGEYRYRRGDGRAVWTRALAAPIEDGTGRIAGAVLALTDVDAERQAASALRDSELRFRTLAEAVPQIVWSTGPDGRLDYINPRFFEFTGLSPGLPLAEAHPPIHPEDIVATRAAWRHALAEGEPYAAECRLRRADGVWRWFAARALPARDADGRILRWIGTATDVTELVETRQALERQVAAEAAARRAAVQAAAALARSEARFRRFAEASPDVMWILDADADRLEFVNPAFERIWGRPVGPEPGLAALTVQVDPADRAAVEAALARLREGEVRDLEYRILRPDGQQRWVRMIGFPMGDLPAGGLRIGGFARDISARKAGERQQRLLIAELNHRVKNTLTIVLSLAQQTARRAGAKDAGAGGGEAGPDALLRRFLANFQGRLLALARGHDLLTASTWRGALLTDVVTVALSPWRAGGQPGGTEAPAGAGRIVVEGPAVWLVPRQALALSLAVHEMATNAVEHGALTVPQGHVLLSWRPTEDAMLLLEWRELDGPAVQPPQRRGFGSRLLEAGLPTELGPGATVELDYAADGLRVRIRFRPAQEGVGE